MQEALEYSHWRGSNAAKWHLDILITVNCSHFVYTRAAFHLPQIKVSILATSQCRMMQIQNLVRLCAKSVHEAKIYNKRHAAVVGGAWEHGNMLFINFLLFLCLGSFSLPVREKRYRHVRQMQLHRNTL